MGEISPNGLGGILITVPIPPLQMPLLPLLLLRGLLGVSRNLLTPKGDPPKRDTHPGRSALQMEVE